MWVQSIEKRGRAMTDLCVVNAAGKFIPPMLIFKRFRINDI